MVQGKYREVYLVLQTDTGNHRIKEYEKTSLFGSYSHLVVCLQYSRKKAETLIKDYLKMSLIKPETYKPVKTILREAQSPYDDLDLLKEVKRLQDIAWEYDLTETQISNAKKQMAIYSGLRQSAYNKNEYQEAKKKYDKENAKIEKLKESGKNLYEKVVAKLKSNPEMIGYKALHNYRADDNAGNTQIGNVIVLFDKDLERVTYVFEMEEFDALQKYIKEEILKEE